MSQDTTKLRLFTALELPQPWREDLGRAGAELGRVGAGDVKAVPPDLMHLTLVFLGYQDAGSLSRIEAALYSAASQVPPFHLTLGRVGCFGQPHRLQVVWVGLMTEPPELQQLHQAIALQLEIMAIPFDRKPLVPHITLARMRRASDRNTSRQVYATMQRLSVPTGASTEVTEFVLMESILSRSGPQYQVVGRFPLTGRRESAFSLSP